MGLRRKITHGRYQTEILELREFFENGAHMVGWGSNFEAMVSRASCPVDTPRREDPYTEELSRRMMRLRGVWSTLSKLPPQYVQILEEVFSLRQRPLQMRAVFGIWVEVALRVPSMRSAFAARKERGTPVEFLQWALSSSKQRPLVADIVTETDQIVDTMLSAYVHAKGGRHGDRAVSLHP